MRGGVSGGRDSGGGAACPCGARCAPPPKSAFNAGLFVASYVSTVLFMPPILHLATASHMRQPTDVCASQISHQGYRRGRNTGHGNFGFSGFQVDGRTGFGRSGGMRLGRCAAPKVQRPVPFPFAHRPSISSHIPKTKTYGWTSGARLRPHPPFTSPLPPSARTVASSEPKRSTPAPCSWGLGA